MTLQLRGITWNHTRGLLPLLATAQRFVETHPEVPVVWEKRSLQEFADAPIERLAEHFDLLVVDHPFVGFAARHGTLLPLDELLPASFLEDQAQHSVGQSYESYSYEGHQWALAIDAATPVSSWRPQWFEQHGRTVPRTWKDLLELASRECVAVPAVPVDCLMNFFMLCSSLGEDPFSRESRVITAELGLEALRLLRELMALCSKDCYFWNPINVYEAMASRDNIVYCPFAYGYSNYARFGYAANRLQFGDLISLDSGKLIRSTLGGSGLAISARCSNPRAASEYVQYVASPQCQRTLYFESGGQPGHRKAWLDENVNAASGNFFLHTLPVLERAYLRPRYAGYLYFQDHAAPVVQQFLRHGGDAVAVLEQLEEIRIKSRTQSHWVET